jgi:acyl carrier protein phosphodiesterase
MNFLAHFYLAYGNEQRLLGQFIADSVKGRYYEEYPEIVREGIREHRLIDRLTEVSEGPMALRAFLRPHCGLLSPVAVDMLLDHVLAKKWHDYHKVPLAEFASNCYQSLESNEALIPERMKEALFYMIKYDWLSAYATKEGIVKSISGLSRRVTGGNLLNNIVPIFEDAVNQAEKSFSDYFPELCKAIKAEISASSEPFLGINHYY